MDRLFEKHYRKLTSLPGDFFKRYLFYQIDWSQRLVGIKGARGAGKTTLLLQYALQLKAPKGHVLYVSLDDIYFSENKLVELTDTFVKNGGKVLLIDEVHRYPQWSVEIKNIYDDYPELQVIFTGSSVIHIEKAKADLSRRAAMYELFGLSLREFVKLSNGIELNAYTIDDIIKSHIDLAIEIRDQLKPVMLFNEYLKHGYYPYFLQSQDLYGERLMSTILLALETDLPMVHEVTIGTISKIKSLLYILAESVPFKPNISKISEKLGVSRNSLITYLHYLEELRIIRKLYASTRGISSMQKPEKLYLHHPNLHFALSFGEVNTGNMRESFFVNQVGAKNKISYTTQGDFIVNEKLLFEIGGKDKTTKQLPARTEGYIASDNLEIGSGNKIPLWLFGFLY